MDVTRELFVERQLAALMGGRPKDEMTMRHRSCWWGGKEVLIYSTNRRGVIINVGGREFSDPNAAAKHLGAR